MKDDPRPVFGQTQEALGLRRFLLGPVQGERWGLFKVNGQWMLWSTTPQHPEVFPPPEGAGVDGGGIENIPATATQWVGESRADSTK